MQIPYRSIEQICESFASDLEARAAVRAGRSYVPLLLLLEHPQGDVHARLRSALAAVGVPAEEANDIRLHELVRYALTADIGAYWGPLALSWIEDGFPVDAAIADALARFAKEKHRSQKARHLAFALSRRWKKANGAADVANDQQRRGVGLH